MRRVIWFSLSSWFVSRGYVVVLPMRRGYGETSGAWAEDYGRCQTPDYFGAGLQGAADINLFSGDGQLHGQNHSILEVAAYRALERSWASRPSRSSALARVGS